MKTMTKIPPQLIPKIYEEEVYKISSKVTETSPVIENPVEKSMQEVLIISNHGTEEADFLEKILAAVSLSMEQVDQKPLSEYSENMPYKKVLIFDENTEYEKYTPEENDGSWKLYGDPLSQIQKDIALKKKLWTALKQLFIG